MNLTKPIIAGACALCALIPAKGEILINEVMQSNVYSIMDDLNDFPDSWIELYNSGDEAVSLYGYRIHVKDKYKSAYSLPSTVIPAGGVVLIYCDKVGEGNHADFRVDSGKGDIFLYDAEGNTVDHVTLKKQPSPEVAYGRSADGSDTWGYELTPTPGLPNAGGLSDVVLGNVVFSTPGGVWAESQNIELTLSLPKNAPEGAAIIYTTDGAEPTAENSKTYTEPITISESTVIRAKAVADGCISIPSDVQSYIYLGRDIDLPVVSIAINDEYLYDEAIGIFARGTIGDLNENWRQNWRRPINLEYFEGEGEKAILNQICETRVHGGLSRTNKLKSMAVYANKRFGTKNFSHTLWAADKPELSSCKSFVLRNAGNDFDGAYMRDGVCQRVIGRNTVVDWQAYSPVIVYINGKYHAMLAIRERSNEDYVEANYGGLEDIDMFENWDELKEGSPVASEEFKDFVFGTHTFDEWSEYINVENFANLMAINYWVYNSDFPMNNVVMWRRTDGGDPRWQWIVKDVDYGLGLWNDESYLHSDFSKFLYTNVAPYVGFDIWQQLMRTDFREYFIKRLVVYMGDFLNARTFHKYIDEIWQSAGGEIAVSHAKWGSSWSDLNYNMEFMHSWVDQREEYMPTLMQESWGLGKPVKVAVNMALTAEELNGAEILYGGIALTQGVFDGYDYMGRTITLTGDADHVVGWTVTVGDDQKTVEGNTLSLEITSAQDITINAITSQAGISSTEIAGKPVNIVGGTVFAEGLIEAYDATGRKVAEGIDALRLPSKGMYIIRANGCATKVAW